METLEDSMTLVVDLSFDGDFVGDLIGHSCASISSFKDSLAIVLEFGNNSSSTVMIHVPK